MSFGGPDLTPEDRKRLCVQLRVVRTLMLDGSWRSLAEIETATGFPQASISARLRDLRKRKFGEYLVERRRRTRAQYEYRVSGGGSPDERDDEECLTA